MTTAREGPEITGHQVFISYYNGKDDPNMSDRPVGDRIYSVLKPYGIRCWMDYRDISPGLSWPDEISKAITQSIIMIVVLSAYTQKSRNVLMEVTQAATENKIIIPFFIENVVLQEGFKLLLGHCHRINAYPSPLKNNFDLLVEAVCQHLGIDSVKTLEPKHLEPEEKPIPEYAKKDGKEKRNVPEDLPADVKNIISKAIKVEKNKNGYWEAYYQDGIVMVYIPPSEFLMGQTEEEKKWLIDQIGINKYNSFYINEIPLHNIHLAGYWIGKYEVTFTQYDRYCEETGKKKQDDRGWGRENRPVINVSWNDAAAYCEWLSGKTGLKFKLPTEAQWEKAARGIDGRKYPWGSREPGKDLANFKSIIGKTTPVGSYPEGASPYGLLDMAGNVWEHCSDWYDNNHVSRGGSWSNNASDVRCTKRISHYPSSPSRFLGFRLCQDI